MQCIWKQNHKNKRFLCVLNSDLGTLFWFIFTCSALVPQTCVLLGQLTSARSFYDSPCRNLRLQPSQALLSSHRLPNSPSHHDEILFRALSVCFWQWPQRVPQGFPHSSAGKEFACDAGDTSSIPGTGRSPGEGIGYPLQYSWASLEAQMVKNPLTLQETWVWSLGWKGPLEKEKATHSRILSWRILWTVESMGSQRVGQDWVTLTFTFGKYHFNLGGLIAFNLDSSFFFSPRKHLHPSMIPKCNNKFPPPGHQFYSPGICEGSPLWNLKYPFAVSLQGNQSGLHTTLLNWSIQPTPVLLPGKSHGWRGLVGCSPWGR